MKFIITCCLALVLTNQAHAQAAQFRGYFAMEQMLGQRVLKDSPRLDLSHYTSDRGLLYLMGSWDLFGVTWVFRNGQPNALSMLIWYTSLSSFADDLAANCYQPRPLKLNDAMASALDGVCQWPQAPAKTDEAMLAFWIAMMGYNAPEEEYIAWRDFFRGPAFANVSAIETVRAMTIAIVMNPNFLLAD